MSKMFHVLLVEKDTSIDSIDDLSSFEQVEAEVEKEAAEKVFVDGLNGIDHSETCYWFVYNPEKETVTRVVTKFVQYVDARYGQTYQKKLETDHKLYIKTFSLKR